MGFLRRRLTYANVISTLCLFMLLGGGAYAATKLPKNSVGAKQIKKGAVNGQKIKKASINSSKLTPATLASLTGTQGARGATGAQGIQGVAGDPGAYATVDPADDVSFIGTHPGFTSVLRVPPVVEGEGEQAEQEVASQRGVYCLVPTPGIDISHPIASSNWADSGGVGTFVEPLARESELGSRCDEGELEIRTYKFENELPRPSNEVSFTIFAPGA